MRLGSKPEESVRADVAAVAAGLAPSRSKASSLIKKGYLLRSSPDGQLRPVTRPSDLMSAGCRLELSPEAELPRFVSRAGDKLEALLSTELASKVVVQGSRCLDVGASTGGFTDCLLQRGAVSVCAIDVGHGQLHQKIASDKRVANLEGINARSVTAEDLTGAGGNTRITTPPFDLVVIDVSFISLELIVPNIWRLLCPEEGHLLALVKPQFEVGRRAVHRGKGVITDEAERRAALDRILALAEANTSWCNSNDDGDKSGARLPGAHVVGWMESPVAGGDGNREWLLILQKTDNGGRFAFDL